MSVILSLNYLNKLSDGLTEIIYSLQEREHARYVFQREIAKLRSMQDGIKKVLANPRDYGYIAKLRDPE